jgi:tetratricopeptide (TPR) repeat protein
VKVYSPLVGFSVLALAITTLLLFKPIEKQMHLLMVIQPLLHHPAAKPDYLWQEECDRLLNIALENADIHQQPTVAGVFLQANCLDAAGTILNKDFTQSNRAAYANFQRGRFYWIRGNKQDAVNQWRNVDQVSDWLVIQAGAALHTDVIQAAEWYEVNIQVAETMFELAQAITLYTERLRRPMDWETFVQRVQELEHYFDSNLAAFYRLRGTRHLMRKNYPEASENLSRAIEHGLDDSETWYWLAESELATNGLDAAEPLFKQALNAPIQLQWRRSWYLYRFGVLLVDSDQLELALPFLEEAAILSDYYVQSAYLSNVYYQLSEDVKAQLFCERARRLAGPQHQALSCEER